MSRMLAFVAASMLPLSAFASPNARLVNPTPPPLDFRSTPPPVRLEAYVVMQEPPAPPSPPAAQPLKSAPAATQPEAAALAPAAPAPQATAPAPAPPSVVEPKPSEVGRSWTYYRDRDGSYFRMRRTGVSKPALWGTGLALVVATWAAAIPFSGYAPVMGGFIAASGSNDATTSGLMIFDGIVGLGGTVLVIVGVAMSKEHVERQPVTVTPIAFHNGGGGAALSVRF